jgi:hypothetical protein
MPTIDSKIIEKEFPGIPTPDDVKLVTGQFKNGSSSTIFHGLQPSYKMVIVELFKNNTLNGSAEEDYFKSVQTVTNMVETQAEKLISDKAAKEAAKKSSEANMVNMYLSQVTRDFAKELFVKAGITAVAPLSEAIKTIKTFNGGLKVKFLKPFCAAFEITEEPVMEKIHSMAVAAMYRNMLRLPQCKDFAGSTIHAGYARALCIKYNAETFDLSVNDDDTAVQSKFDNAKKNALLNLAKNHAEANGEKLEIVTATFTSYIPNLMEKIQAGVLS